MPPTQPMCPMPGSASRGEVLDLGLLVAETVSGLSASLTSHTLTFSGEAECPVWGRPAALRRLARSLIRYAVEHSAPGRTVSVEVWRRGDFACLVVEDEGRGVPPAATDRLFRPFTRLDSLPDILEAYGAEMTAVHLIAATHEATVAVQGLAGQGTTFEICFPLVREPEETARNCVP